MAVFAAAARAFGDAGVLAGVARVCRHGENGGLDCLLDGGDVLAAVRVAEGDDARGTAIHRQLRCPRPSATPRPQMTLPVDAYVRAR